MYANMARLINWNISKTIFMHIKCRIHATSHDLELQCLFLSFFLPKQEIIQNFHSQYNATCVQRASPQSSSNVDCLTDTNCQAQLKTADQEQVIKYKIDSPCCYTPAWNYKISTQQYRSVNFQLHSASLPQVLHDTALQIDFLYQCGSISLMDCSVNSPCLIDKKRHPRQSAIHSRRHDWRWARSGIQQCCL